MSSWSLFKLNSTYDKMKEDMQKKTDSKSREAEAAKEEARDNLERAKKAQEEASEEKERAKKAMEQASDARERANRMQENLTKFEDKEKQEDEQKKLFKWGPKNPGEGSEKTQKAQKCEKLRKKFQKEQTTQKGHTFLMFGPTSHGKSSFGNGCLAALEDRDRPPTYHYSAQSNESVSKGFSVKNYQLHRIIDMPGIFEGEDIKSEDIKKIVTGQVPWVSDITKFLVTLDKEKSHNDTVECIIIILKYDTELPKELRRQIGVIWGLCGEGVLSCHLVLTHLDVCDPQFKDTENLPNIYKSPKVLAAVEEMSKQTGIPPFNISFVKNYTTEQETDLDSKIQFLRILDAVNESADYVVEARSTKATLIEEYKKENESLTENSSNLLDRVLTYHEFFFFLGIIFIAILVVYFQSS